MKKKYKIIIGILLVLIVGFYFCIKTIESNIDQLNDLRIINVDISKVEDGSFIGSYKVFPITAEVKVTVANHEIREIELLKHKSGQGVQAEIIPSKVVEAQTLEVDAVSGATLSSKVILKAIENALVKANE